MNATENVYAVKVKGSGSGSWTLYELEEAWVESPCPHCGGTQALRVAYAEDVRWLRCVTCHEGAVDNGGTISPSTRPLRTPEKLPREDLALWEEIRTCLGAGAYMAVALLCRKHLLHVAVVKGLEPKNERGFAPNFAECIDHLVAKGVITEVMREWVEPIKDVGNTAAHEIEPVTPEQATKAATFTLQLLVLAYEMRMGPPGAA